MDGRRRITLTRGEREWAEWSIGGMPDDPEGREEMYGRAVPDSEMPRVEGRTLVVPTDPEVLEDLLYRLEEMAPNVSENDAVSGAQIAARARPALTLAAKVRGLHYDAHGGPRCEDEDRGALPDDPTGHKANVGNVGGHESDGAVSG
jgi:hypothetical protein